MTHFDDFEAGIYRANFTKSSSMSVPAIRTVVLAFDWHEKRSNPVVIEISARPVLSILTRVEDWFVKHRDGSGRPTKPYSAEDANLKGWEYVGEHIIVHPILVGDEEGNSILSAPSIVDGVGSQSDVEWNYGLMTVVCDWPAREDNARFLSIVKKALCYGKGFQAKKGKPVRLVLTLNEFESGPANGFY